MSRERITLRRLSEETGISTSTLSRALNNCAGVDAETRRAAQDAARRLGYTPPERRRGDAAVILPHAPEYFWKEALDSIQQSFADAEMPFRLAMYAPSCGDGEILSLIDSLAVEAVRALIMPVTSPAVAAHLHSMSDRVTVFQLCDFGEIRNSFVFCSDGMADGAALADAVFTIRPGARVLQLSAETCLSRLREEGFASRCPPDCTLGTLPLPHPYSIHNAADIARVLSIACAEAPDVIVCNDGILPQLALAVIKCRWKERTLCAGYECPPTLRKYIDTGMIAAFAEQDIRAASAAAVRAAVQYLTCGECPAEKFTRYASELHLFR